METATFKAHVDINVTCINEFPRQLVSRPKMLILFMSSEFIINNINDVAGRLNRYVFWNLMHGVIIVGWSCLW